jgi:hypothetical protein
MRWPPGTRWLAALATGRRRRAVEDDDPAGMGTAFGLDASTLLDSELAAEMARLTAPGGLATPVSHLESRLVRRSAL